jgi:hypothetical protein
VRKLRDCQKVNLVQFATTRRKAFFVYRSAGREKFDYVINVISVDNYTKRVLCDGP